MRTPEVSDGVQYVVSWAVFAVFCVTLFVSRDLSVARAALAGVMMYCAVMMVGQRWIDRAP